MKRLDKYPVTDRALATVQDRLLEVVNPIAAVPLLDGRRIEQVTIGTSATSVAHLLGRVPLGYIVTRRSSAGVLCDSAPATGHDELFLYLAADAAVTVDLWVF